MSLTEYAEQMSRKIKIPRDIKMNDFKEYIETNFEIEDAVIMKRTPLMQNQAVEILSSSD